MNIEEGLELLQSVVFAKTHQHLHNLQIAVLRGSCENQSYEEIAETHCFSAAYAKTMGAKLWAFLSQVIGAKVNKKNFCTILERKAKEWKAAVTEDGAADGLSDVADLVDGVADGLSDGLLVKSAAPLPILTSAAPLPELPGGQVPLNSSFYIERSPIENRCYNTITQPGALIRIHSPRQMGKTSLMARILHQGRAEGYRTVTLSFQVAGSNIFTNLDRFLQWFCASVGKSLGLPNRLADYWDDILGGNSSATDYFENYLLAEIDSPLLLALDEFDCLCQYPEIASNFFGLLRSWYEKAKYGNSLSDVWQKLRLLVVHSSAINICHNINLSPFNIGLSIELPEFTSEQVQDLASHHGLNWEASKVEKLMSLVGGYPYLIQKALYHIAHQDVTLEDLMPKSATKGRVYGEHLHQQLSHLQLYPELVVTLNQVVSSTTPVELNRIPALKLRSMGLVRLMGGSVVPSCDLYRQYFLNCHC